MFSNFVYLVAFRMPLGNPYDLPSPAALEKRVNAAGMNKNLLHLRGKTSPHIFLPMEVSRIKIRSRQFRTGGSNSLGLVGVVVGVNKCSP